MTDYVKTYSQLTAYRKVRALAREIFEVSTSFPREEICSLIDQVRRSSRSVAAQIAEAWAKRRYEKHFVSKLTDADGERQATQHWIEVARDCDYISAETARSLHHLCNEVGRLLGGMITKSHLFCQFKTNQLSEPLTEYIITDH